MPVPSEAFTLSLWCEKNLVEGLKQMSDLTLHFDDIILAAKL